MAARLHRAALTLLCAVAIIYGTALFPAAFDVELQAEQPAAAPPGTPATDTPETATPTESTSGSTDSATETPTPEPTPPPTTEAMGSGSGGTDSDGLAWFPGLGYAFVALLLAFVGGGVFYVLRGLNRPRAGGNFSLPSIALPEIPFVGSLRRIPQITTALLITGGSGLARVVDGVATVGVTVVTELGRAAGPAARIASTALFTAPAAVLTSVTLPFRALSGLGSLAGGLSSFGSLGGPNPETPDADARERAAVEPAAEPDESEPVPSIAAAWAAMTELVPVRNHAATTPAEYARAAVAHGLPEEPVRRLTRLFREVRYGGHSESPDRLGVARRALDALRGGED